VKKPSKVLAACLSVALGATPAAAAARACSVSDNVSTVAADLNNPRGLKFGPDGRLYVAEGGAGGTLSSVQCALPQVDPPVGPYTGDFTASIARIDTGGVVTRIASGLPSSQTAPDAGGFVSGVSDVAFIGGTLYGLLAGAGCTHGLDGTSNDVVRVNANGTTTPVADLGAFQVAHPVANPSPGDFEPEGTWYSMVAVRGSLYAVEPNHGEIVRVSPEGAIQRVVDLSAQYGHVVPTAIAYDGNFYVGTLGTFDNGFLGRVIKVTPSGETSIVVDGLTSITGLVVDRGSIYILENEGGFVVPCAGRVLRVDRSGNLARAEEIATGLMFPTAMTLGPDGNLYVSNFGYMFGGGAGLGEIVRVDLR
jgi:hypothetical protein